MKTAMRLIAAWLGAAAIGGCAPDAASPDDCERILDRVVELVLAEHGLSDPVLSDHWRETFHRQLARELARCPDHTLDPEQLACALAAPTADALVDQCLR